MSHYIAITPRDPLIARDGRPFGADAGNRMRSLDWLYPSVVAGSLRTLLGKQSGAGFDADTVGRLKALEVSGPLPVVDTRLFLPRPLDCLVREEEGRRDCYAVRPVQLDDSEGCDLPQGLRPALLPDEVVEEFKPADIRAFWSLSKTVEWLRNPEGRDFPVPPSGDDRTHREQGNFLGAPSKDIRTHVKMSRNTGAGEEGQLFSTTGLDFSLKGSTQPLRMAIRVEGDEAFRDVLDTLDAVHPLGGERRLAHWQVTDGTRISWESPPEIQAVLSGSRRIRLVLATPAIFSGGWKPGWISSGAHALEGAPVAANVRLRLVSAVIARWQPLSGWSLEKGTTGPKPIRRMVPAGSVYFFEVTEGDGADLAACWLKSVCDAEQDRRDGFGLALWGIWDEHIEKGGNPS